MPCVASLHRVHVTTGGYSPLAPLVRLKGIAWLASHYEQQALLSLAGLQFSVQVQRTWHIILHAYTPPMHHLEFAAQPGAPWWAALGRETWPDGLDEALAPLWHEPHGDRQSEIVCIGQGMERAGVEEALRACVLTDDEFAAGAEAWAALEDPFAEDWAFFAAVREEQQAAERAHAHAHA